MSWGERSCKHFAIDCPMNNVTINTCTIYCPAYVSNGEQPDTGLGSIKKQDVRVYTIPTKKQIKRLKKKGKLK